MAEDSDELRQAALHAAFVVRVRELMSGKGLSLNKLADFSGLSRGHLSDLLAGKSSPTLRSMAKLAQALGVSVRDLLPSGATNPSGPAKHRKQP